MPPYPRPHAFIQELESYLAPHSMLADVGSHNGYNGLSLSEVGHTVVNIDVVRESLQSGLHDVSKLGAIATRNFFIQGDARNLMFADSTFNAVISMNMMQHLSSEDSTSALNELQRVTKPGGYNAIKVYAGTTHEITVRPRFTIFKFEQLRQKYQSKGWHILKYDEQHIEPTNDTDGISSYSKIIARKPSGNETIKQDLLRRAEYYRRVDIDYCDLLIEQAHSL
jgi:ubiquinone/menaquinone biosynthesis C-methylase UbiE